MKLFGAWRTGREPRARIEAGSVIPPSPPEFPPHTSPPASSETEMRQQPWFKGLVSGCGVLLVIAVCVEVYRRAERYSAGVVERNPVAAFLEIGNPPGWLHPQIIAGLREEAVGYACRDDATFDRAQNILDSGILREVADLYTGSPARQAIGFNAWIKRVTEVRRNVAKDKSQQTIEIFAQWRSPAAWVRYGQTLVLVDNEGIRLPGDYPLEDRRSSGLMVISGVAAPNGVVPQPGAVWGGSALSEDLSAGMKLVEALRRQRYAGQIDSIDVTNFNGRVDGRGAWILLTTVWPVTNGTGLRTVQWGRPIGEERYFEVQANVKLKALNDIFLRFNRIDADRDYVDIRTETVKLPKLAAQTGGEMPVRSNRG